MKEVIVVGISVKDLSTEELQALISSTVRETMEDFMENMLALSSENYLRSIEEARRDYKEGRIKPIEEVFDV